MKTLFLILALVGVAHSQRCGKERWAVKTLKDSSAVQIGTIPTPTTITELRSLPAPDDVKKFPNQRFEPVEKTRYQIQALLKGFKLENDSDYHLVLQDPNAPVTMIGEIPAPACAAPEIGHKLYIERAWMVQHFGKAPTVGRMKRLKKPVLVEIEGIGFFDFIHGQTGVAPNGIEIHPILSIQAVK